MIRAFKLFIAIIIITSCNSQNKIDNLVEIQTNSSIQKSENTNNRSEYIQRMKEGYYWQPNGGKISFLLTVKEVSRSKIRLRYKIIQDQSRSGAFLTILINNRALVANEVIGEVNPKESILITDEKDISNFINKPGDYILTFDVKEVDNVEKGWLLTKELKVIGIEGTLKVQ